MKTFTKYLSFSRLALFFFCSTLLAQPVIDVGAWYRERMAKIDSLETQSEKERMLGLAEIVEGLSRGRDRNKEVLSVYTRAQGALLETPGYAEFFEKEIKDAYLKWGVFPKKGELHYRGAYGIKQQEMFDTLENLPSPQTVRVLGNFLSDHRGEFDPAKETFEQYVEAGIPKNSDAACNRLREMIDYPPFQKLDAGDPKTLEAWTTWYTQVKEGRRTFRFKGNPQEYDLNGPVTEAKNPDIPRPIKRPDSISSDRSVSDRSTTSTNQASAARNASTLFTTPWITGVILLVLLIGGYIMKSKRKIRS